MAIFSVKRAWRLLDRLRPVGERLAKERLRRLFDALEARYQALNVAAVLRVSLDEHAPQLGILGAKLLDDLHIGHHGRMMADVGWHTLPSSALS
jgi:hypothetical protein